MSEANKAVVARWFEEVWNQGRTDAIDSMFSPDGLAHGLGEDMRGPEAFKAFHAQFRSSYANVRVQVDDMVAEGDKVAYRFTATATHSGNGRPARFEGMGFTRIRNGQIVEGWNVLDQLGMLTQMGVVQL